MTQHYRHHRVARRIKQAEAPSYSDTICKAVMREPFLALGLLLLFFLLLIKCLICHK